MPAGQSSGSPVLPCWAGVADDPALILLPVRPMRFSPWLGLLGALTHVTLPLSAPSRNSGAALELHLRPDPEDAREAPVAEVLGVMLGTALPATLTSLTFDSRWVRKG